MLSATLSSGRGSAFAWRRSLRRAIAGVLALKLAAITLIWWLFFSGAHVPDVTPTSMSRQLGIDRGAVTGELDHG